MNRIVCTVLIVALIGLAAATENDGTTTTTKPSAPPVYVPAAPTGGSNSGGGGGGESSEVAALLHNPAYDPTIYTSFVPQDAVQQYVSQYGSGYAGQALEGFLIPTFDRPEYTVEPSPTVLAIVKSFLPGPKIIFAVVAKIVALLASAIGVIFFGGAITSFVCAFTPLCTITFLGKPLALLKQETKDIVEKIGEELTAERVKRAADLFRLALDKYQAMNQKS